MSVGYKSISVYIFCLTLFPLSIFSVIIFFLNLESVVEKGYSTFEIFGQAIITL